jgi:hypothetical protein
MNNEKNIRYILFLVLALFTVVLIHGCATDLPEVDQDVEVNDDIADLTAITPEEQNSEGEDMAGQAFSRRRRSRSRSYRRSTNAYQSCEVSDNTITFSYGSSLSSARKYTRSGTCYRNQDQYAYQWSCSGKNPRGTWVNCQQQGKKCVSGECVASQPDPAIEQKRLADLAEEKRVAEQKRIDELKKANDTVVKVTSNKTTTTSSNSSS